MGKVKCFECYKGEYEQVTKDFKIEYPDGNIITVPAVVHYICNKCGDEEFDSMAWQYIDDYINAMQDKSKFMALYYKLCYRFVEFIHRFLMFF